MTLSERLCQTDLRERPSGLRCGLQELGQLQQCSALQHDISRSQSDSFKLTTTRPKLSSLGLHGGWTLPACFHGVTLSWGTREYLAVLQQRSSVQSFPLSFKLCREEDSATEFATGPSMTVLSCLLDSYIFRKSAVATVAAFLTCLFDERLTLCRLFALASSSTPCMTPG